jgi:group I intron endonuclease
MKKTGLIYLATNKVNGKKYVGQTIFKLEKRIKQHLLMSKRKKIGFDRAIAKYGIKNFKWKVVENNCPVKKLNEKEIFYIAKFKTYIIKYPDKGYNLTIGGNNNFGSKGKFHFINRMSKKEKEKWFKKYRCGKNNPNYGNGKNLCGKNHFSKRMTKKERKKWIDGFSGNNNYQKKMTKKQLREKCYINKMTKKEKKEWTNKYLKGKNNPFAKVAYLYRGKNSPLYGKTGLLSKHYKKYIITFPDGREFLAICLSEFCKKFNNLNKIKLRCCNLSWCAGGNKEYHKGFKCKHFFKKTDSKIKEYQNETI